VLTALLPLDAFSSLLSLAAAARPNPAWRLAVN
jgi:hypothetical protein